MSQVLIEGSSSNCEDYSLSPLVPKTQTPTPAEATFLTKASKAGTSMSSEPALKGVTRGQYCV